ncbi:MAG: UbiA-like polyprenyltransferase [Verrucomicrobiota bacterium]
MEAVEEVIDRDRGNLLQRLGKFVRFSHTLFALPFALVSMLVAGQGFPPMRIIVGILICMVAARTSAMAFNRIVDWDYDKGNPRTADRHKLVTKQTATIVVWLSSAVFVVGAWYLNVLCLALAPVAVALIFFYSVTKRFTHFSHFFLGLSLSAAPMGAWAAVNGELWSLAPYILAFGVLLWVFGFDLIYSTMDEKYDRSAGLYSFPSRYGVQATLKLSRVLHALAILTFAWFGFEAGLSWGFWAALLVCAGGLIWEHKLSKSGDIGLINKAFFEVNAIVSLAFLVGVSLDIFFLLN